MRRPARREGSLTISMLGAADGTLPGGFAVLDAKTFEVLGRWEQAKGDQQMMYDFWYQPRHNRLLSSEWAAPATYQPGFELADVQAGRYGHRLHVWDLEQRAHRQTIEWARAAWSPWSCAGCTIPTPRRASRQPRSPARSGASIRTRPRTGHGRRSR